jgi:hypothetical protein
MYRGNPEKMMQQQQEGTTWPFRAETSSKPVLKARAR